MSEHWPHKSSRCPECGIKQGDILPDIQPCSLSTRIAALESERDDAREDRNAASATADQAIDDWAKAESKLTALQADLDGERSHTLAMHKQVGALQAVVDEQQTVMREASHAVKKRFPLVARCLAQIADSEHPPTTETAEDFSDIDMVKHPPLSPGLTDEEASKFEASCQTCYQLMSACRCIR